MSVCQNHCNEVGHILECCSLFIWAWYDMTISQPRSKEGFQTFYLNFISSPGISGDCLSSFIKIFYSALPSSHWDWRFLQVELSDATRRVWCLSGSRRCPAPTPRTPASYLVGLDTSASLWKLQSREDREGRPHQHPGVLLSGKL